MEQQTTFIPDGMNAFERNVKRVGDCMIAGILMIIFSPLFLACYIAVKREDGGPAIFRQERIGRFGRPFYIYKFRSMRLDAEKMGPALYKGGKDERLTKVGKFLREHHLDELPQLWNVFCGFYWSSSRTEIFHRSDNGTRCSLRIFVSDTTGRNFVCYAIQWVHRYDG